jgi:hypothetical protein
MNAARQFQGFSWIILRVFLIGGLCGPLAAASYSGGDGTSDTPYLLSTADDLATLANTPADWGKWFILTTNVDMSSTPFATPIGTRTAPFTGVFDGAGHSIRGLVIDDTAASSRPLGLFGVLGALALVERLQFVAPSVRSVGNMSVGVLAGEVAADAVVQQCGVEQGSVSTPASDAAGGLIGDNGGTVRECYSTASVTALGLAGGLLGRNTGTVENCVATSAATTLKVGTGTAVGGLLGADVGGTVRFCLANSPSLTGARPGGLVGFASDTSVLTNCVSNKVAPKAVENWAADIPGSAWCEEASNLASATFFTGLGWDLQTVWAMEGDTVLRLRWMAGGLIAVIKGPTDAVPPDPKTGLAQVTLDGSQSINPEASDLKYNWKCLTPSGGSTGITIDPVASPTVNLPVGTYRIELTINNGLSDSAPTAFTVTVGTAITPKAVPTAMVKGPTGVVRPDPATGLAKVTLDGSQSSDPDKKALKYNWKCLTATGGATNITISSIVSPVVTLPAGVYRIELVVNNGVADSAPFALTVTVNAAPTAAIKPPSGTLRPDAASGYAKVTLDGSASSDPEKDALKYNWKCLTASGGSTGVTIDSVATPTISLRAGTYRIELTVNDGAGDSAPFAISLTIGGTNSPPTAVIRGPTGAVRPDPATGQATIGLDGSASSDPDKDALKYNWKCLTPTGAPTGIAINPVVKPSLTLRVGVYRIELTVNDGTVDSAVAVITVTVKDSAGPKAVARGPSGVVRPDPVTGLARIALDGSQSSDPDQDPLKYMWRCLTATGAATGVTIESVANPSVDLYAGAYKIELTVNDGTEDSAPDAIIVTVNTAPTARISCPLELFAEGTGTQRAQLDGSKSSDPEAGKGQTLAYTWTCTTASPSTVLGVMPVMDLPVGVHTVQLVVSDGLESAQATAQIVVNSVSGAVRTAASPSTIGRTSEITDVKFYVLLPAGKSVYDVDTQAPIDLEINGARTLLVRDPTYSHKKYTVVAYTARKTVLDLAGPTNGLKPAKVVVRLKTGESVSGTINLQVVAGLGTSSILVLAERTSYYFDTQTWK